MLAQNEIKYFNGIHIFENNKPKYYSLEQSTSQVARRKLFDDISVKPEYPFSWDSIWKNIPENAKRWMLAIYG